MACLHPQCENAKSDKFASANLCTEHFHTIKGTNLWRRCWIERIAMLVTERGYGITKIHSSTGLSYDELSDILGSPVAPGMGSKAVTALLEQRTGVKTLTAAQARAQQKEAGPSAGFWGSS